MVQVSQMKISELAKLTNTSIPLISRHFKSYDEMSVTKTNKRVT